MEISLSDLTETWSRSQIPITERDPQSDLQKQWARNGFVIVKKLIPDLLMYEYEDEWMSANGGLGSILGKISTYSHPFGWPYATPYMNYGKLRRIVCCRELSEVLEHLICEPMGVHLNLTGWVSTRRNWHRDQYLNEAYVGGFYTAVWIALDTVHADAGPFEYIASSHTGAAISQTKMRMALGPDGQGPLWPTHSEKILTPLFEQEIVSNKSKISNNVGMERGDVLIWHGKLLHRGSVPTNENAERRSLIAHYSGIHHRPDMPPAVQHKEQGGWYFPINGQMPTGYDRTNPLETR